MGGLILIWVQFNIWLNVLLGGYIQVVDEFGGNEDVGWVEVMDRGMFEIYQS